MNVILDAILAVLKRLTRWDDEQSEKIDKDHASVADDLKKIREKPAENVTSSP